MSERLLAGRMWRVTWSFIQSVAAFLGAVVAMVVGTGALWVMVVFVIILILGIGGASDAIVSWRRNRRALGNGKPRIADRVRPGFVVGVKNGAVGSAHVFKCDG
ncbi:hypothetical protein [Methylocystis sp.]|uniref:hypothetical protein n=1 Tax=Methylocystis sp. TaxID=1911079 RepID=UPI0025F788DB|nr:hypothetical protein [Methylocystis sp.]